MEAVPFQVEVDREGQRLMMSVQGELDFANSSKLQATLQDELREPNVTLVLDFNNLTFLDSEGLRVIIRAYRCVTEAGGKISVTGCSKTVEKLFDIVGLRGILGVD